MFKEVVRLRIIMLVIFPELHKRLSEFVDTAERLFLLRLFMLRVFFIIIIFNYYRKHNQHRVIRCITNYL